MLKGAKFPYKTTGKGGVGEYKLPDIVNKRPDSGVIVITPTPVNVVSTFEKDIGDTAWKKYYAPIIDKEAARYQEIIEKESAILAKKVIDLTEKGDTEKAKKMIEATNRSIENALKTLPGNLDSLMKAEFDRQKKRHITWKKAQVKTAVSALRIGISMGASIAKLVGSAGSDVSSYYALVKQVQEAGQLIYQNTKDEKKLRSDLHKGYKAFLESTKEDTIQPATAALGVYKNHATKTLGRALKVSKNADSLQKNMKSEKNLKNGIKIGAKTMSVKREAGRLIDKYNDYENYADEYERVLAQSRVKLQKFVDTQLSNDYDKAVKAKDGKLNEVLAQAKAFLDIVDDLKGDIEDILG